MFLPHSLLQVPLVQQVIRPDLPFHRLLMLGNQPFFVRMVDYLFGYPILMGEGPLLHDSSAFVLFAVLLSPLVLASEVGILVFLNIPRYLLLLPLLGLQDLPLKTFLVLFVMQLLIQEVS